MTIFTSINIINPLSNSLNLGIPTGHGNNLHSKFIFWPSMPLRYASVCRRQSAGETQGGAVRHHTDIWHITAVLWR